MAQRPDPTWVMHFTDLSHLRNIIDSGLLCDTTARSGHLIREAGNPGIKATRRMRPVPIEPFGCVGDYVPFYFAPRSPMMSAISYGRVPEYGSDVTSLVYLVTTTALLVETGQKVIVSDRNAAMSIAAFHPVAECDDVVDWDLMKQRYWNNTDQHPDRRERRMAECLVHGHVPFGAFCAIGVYRAEHEEYVRSILPAGHNVRDIGVVPEWYI